jgi:hypothetical protein
VAQPAEQIARVAHEGGMQQRDVGGVRHHG